MKHIIKGKPKLQYKKPCRGFNHIGDPILLFTLNDGEQRLCSLQIELNEDALIFENPFCTNIKEIDINNPKDKEIFHLIDEIYSFHGFDLKKYSDDQGIIKTINVQKIERYMNSLSELELEFQQINNGFTYKIINLSETDINFKEILAKLIIGQRAII